MAKQLTDDELNLKRKARRRLIGAVALTLAVVVILPMVLDSEPKSTGQDIDLRIPAPDKVGEFVPGVAASEVAAASPFAASAVQASSAVSAAPVLMQPELAKPTVAPTAVSAGKVATIAAKPEAPAKTQSDAQKPTEAKAADKPVKAQAAKVDAAESYVAQVGAYSNAETARQELVKLKKWGFKAYTEKVGDKVRVRVGPYAQRDKAEKVRQLLEKHGLHPVITNVQ